MQAVVVDTLAYCILQYFDNCLRMNTRYLRNLMASLSCTFDIASHHHTILYTPKTHQMCRRNLQESNTWVDFDTLLFERNHLNTDNLRHHMKLVLKLRIVVLKSRDHKPDTQPLFEIARYNLPESNMLVDFDTLTFVRNHSNTDNPIRRTMHNSKLNMFVTTFQARMPDTMLFL